MTGHFFQRGGIWVLVQGVLLVAVIGLGLCYRGQWHSLPLTLLGGFLLVLAGLCGFAGAAALGRNLTPFPKPSAHTQLVQSGIYGLMRHPLYTAVTCGALGWALILASGPALIAALALAPFFDAKARQEERWLRQQFPEYAEYEQRVRRFIPWLY
ncbi:MAG TPA: isoprenylcysteine carboxylmethyltransferase family protein [Candidatus Sulfotelmatobacter sp.]|nr:isoprenylcysteine carboxylmethyltransferase family protein [Candidatus Sulfotelmatobacter sp.]HWI58218.1 isoprenylcysteine carboxylmethyltransferase family protein [Bacillota bacterium]